MLTPMSCTYRSGVGAPVVGDCDGEYNYDSRKNTLQWNLTVIDESNKSGSLEFSVRGHPDDFFPVAVSFVSKKSYCDIQVSLLQVSFCLCSGLLKQGEVFYTLFPVFERSNKRNRMKKKKN